MRGRSRRTCIALSLGVFVLGIAAACGGGGGGSDESNPGSAAAVTDSTGANDGKSPAQEAFYAARGYPDQFVTIFAAEAVNDDGTVVPLSPTRRIDNFIYNRSSLTSALFDKGYYVDEENWGAGESLVSTTLNPTLFVPGMTRGNVTALLGEPSCEESYSLAGRTIQVMRYNPTTAQPAVSVALMNGQISSVTAGFAIRPDGAANTNVCS